MTDSRSRPATFIFDNSMVLLGGEGHRGGMGKHGERSYDDTARPLHFWVSDVGMCEENRMWSRGGFPFANRRTRPP